MKGRTNLLAIAKPDSLAVTPVMKGMWLKLPDFMMSIGFIGRNGWSRSMSTRGPNAMGELSVTWNQTYAGWIARHIFISKSMESIVYQDDFPEANKFVRVLLPEAFHEFFRRVRGTFEVFPQPPTVFANVVEIRPGTKSISRLRDSPMKESCTHIA